MDLSLQCLEFSVRNIEIAVHHLNKSILQMYQTESRKSTMSTRSLLTPQQTLNDKLWYHWNPTNNMRYALPHDMMCSYAPVDYQRMQYLKLYSASSATPALRTTHNLLTPDPTSMISMNSVSADQEIIKLQNVLSSANVGCELNLKHIALHALNVEYYSNRSVIIMRIRKPRTTVLIYKTGKLVCSGAKSVNDSKLALRKYARIIQKLNYSARFLDFKVHNMMGSYDVKFPIRIEALALSYSDCCSYEPERFRGVVFRMTKPNVVLLIFKSGKVLLNGAKVRKELNDAITMIYPVLKMFQNKNAINKI